MSFMGQFVSRQQSGVIDPWNYLDPAAYPAAECRSIPVTDEMRAEDERHRASSAAGRTAEQWRARIQSGAATKEPKRTPTVHARAIGPERKAKPKHVEPQTSTKGDSGKTPEQPAGEVHTTLHAAMDQREPYVPEVVHHETLKTEGDSKTMAEIAGVEPEVVHAEKPVVPAKSNDERLADEVWQALSVEDKWALLEAVI